MTTWNVASGGDLQSVINSASLGDTILIAAGATFVGPFTLPVKSGTGYLTLRSDTLDANLPAPGVRITPAYAGLLPKLVTPGFAQPALQTTTGAHHFQFIGVEFAPVDANAFLYDLIDFGYGSSTQNLLEQVPHDLILDRCYIHGWPTGSMSRGVGLNSASTQIINCYLSDIHGIGYDTQAICGWNGPGPFTITNNYLEASGENVMFGGADPSITNLVPSDILIEGNTFYKPLSWRVSDPSYAGIHWTVKNHLELKNAQRVTISNNLFENVWADAQAGGSIGFTVRNNDGTAPWSTVQDIQFTNNVIRHAGVGLTILGYDNNFPSGSQRSKRILIQNNLWDDINGDTWGGSGSLWQIFGNPDTVTIDHNTAFQSGNFIAGDDVPNISCTNLTLTNNIFPHNAYGMAPQPIPYAAYWPGLVWQKNVIVAVPVLSYVSLYPASTFWPSAWTDVGFVNKTGGDYSLSSASPYKNAATDGTDIGYIGSGYVAPVVSTYTVSGRVTVSGIGLSGATVTIGGHILTTQPDGTYSQSVLPAGTYLVSVSMAGYTFSTAQMVAVAWDIAGIDFTGTYTPTTTPPVTIAPGGGGGRTIKTKKGGGRTITASGGGRF